MNLPHQLAAITTPESAATSLKPLIINSLAIMMITNHDGKSSISTKQISALQTSSLSARGSINLPKLVTRLHLLAICPSRKSVKLATQKIASAIQAPLCPHRSVKRKNIKNGISITLSIVSLLGKFITKFSDQIVFIASGNTHIHYRSAH